MAVPTDLLNRLLEPVGQALSPDAAKRLVALRADAETQAHVDAPAERCNEGQLTEDERAEHESLVAAAGVIAVLPAKARGVLSGNSAA